MATQEKNIFKKQIDLGIFAVHFELLLALIEGLRDL